MALADTLALPLVLAMLCLAGLAGLMLLVGGLLVVFVSQSLPPVWLGAYWVAVTGIAIANTGLCLRWLAGDMQSKMFARYALRSVLALFATWLVFGLAG